MVDRCTCGELVSARQNGLKLAVRALQTVGQLGDGLPFIEEQWAGLLRMDLHGSRDGARIESTQIGRGTPCCLQRRQVRTNETVSLAWLERPKIGPDLWLQLTRLLDSQRRSDSLVQGLCRALEVTE